MNIYDLFCWMVALLGAPLIIAMLIYIVKCAELEEIKEARNELRDAMPWASKTKLILEPDYQPIVVVKKKRKKRKVR